MMLLGSVIQASCTSMIALLCSGISLGLFVLVYYLLNRQITEHQLTEVQVQNLDNHACCSCQSQSINKNGTLIAINDSKQAEAALQQSERQFRAVFNGALDAMVIVDDAAKYIDANPAACELFGLSKEELLRSVVSAFAAPSCNFVQAWSAFQKQGQMTGEFRLLRPDGTLREVEYTATASFLPNRHLAVLRDITDRKQVEENLRQSEEQLRLALEAAQMGTWQWNVLTNQVTGSSGYEKLFGLTPETFDGTFNPVEACIYPDDREPMLQVVHKARLEGEDYHHEFRVVWSDGSIHWIEGRGRFFEDETGEPVRMIGTVMDISDRKHREEQLRLLESVVVNSNDAVLITEAEPVDKPGPRIVYANSAFTRMTGFRLEEVINQTPRLLQGPKTDPTALERIRAALQTWQPVRVDLINYRKDGSEFWVDLSIVPVANEAGWFTHWVSVQREITERKQTEAVLRQVNEELEIRVAERTAELSQANQQLQRELSERERVEQALRESEERWQLAIRGSKDGIWDLNIKTHQVFYSPQWKEMLGYEDHEIGNQMDEWAKRVHPDDLERVMQVHQDHLTGKTPFYTNEHRLLCKDGTYKWILTRGQALWDEEGNAVRVTGFHTDISGRKQVEEALRESEERFRSAFDYASIGMALVGLEGYWLKVNPAICEIVGYSEQELLTMTFQSLTHPDDLKTDLNHVEQLLRGEIRTYDMQKRYLHKRGHIVWILLSVSLMRDLQGQPLYFIAQIQDISDAYQQAAQRKQAEEERAELIAILEATSDIVASAGNNERTRYLNSAARKLFGVGENQDLDEFTILDAHPDWAYELVRNEGIPAAKRDGVWVGETAFLSHDGREIPVSQLIIAHKSPDGSIKMLSTIARDITQQQQIAATLFESERRWRSLLENVRLVVVGLDNKGKIEYVNPCFLELVGYTKAELLGKDWFETFLPAHQRHRVHNNFIGLLEEEFHSHDQNSILTKSGEERVIAWNNTLLQDLQGCVIGTLSIGEDITERQVIERMKDEFISVVSHELRTPLTSIHGALNLLSSGLVNTQSEKGRRVIEIAAESAERLVRLVNDILELERLESGKISLALQQCNAADLIKEAIDTMQVMANRAGITLSISPVSIQLNADRDRIIQVLTNLLGNAIKFSPSGSTVWLTVESGAKDWGLGNLESPLRIGDNGDFPKPNATVLFKVKDQGRGIPEDKLESIFERFHQVDASDSRKKGGTGLGLAICRSIVQQHGGRIWVESTLGEGSSFYFTLPKQIIEDDNDGNQAHLGD